MENEILDSRFSDANDLKMALKKGGIERFFELQNGKIIVRETDTVQVTIDLQNGKPIVKTKFPTIGNFPQIIVTVLLLIIAMFFNLPFSWAIAILFGQLFSYLWFMPKIKKLKAKIEAVL